MGLGASTGLDQLERIAVGIATEERGPPGATEGIRKTCGLEPRGYLVQAAHPHREMAVSTAVCRTARNRIRIRQLEQVDLLIAHPKPGPGERQIRALRDTLETQNPVIEVERPRGVGDDQTDMMDGVNQRHRIPLGMEPAWTFAYTKPRPE